MIKLMISNEATGNYSAGIACAGMTTFVFSAIIDSMRPLIVKSKRVATVGLQVLLNTPARTGQRVKLKQRSEFSLRCYSMY